MRLRDVISGICVLGFVVGCGTSKKPLISPRVVANIDAIKTDTVAKIVEAPRLVVDNSIDSSFVQAPRELTPEEKIAEQKRTGLYKGADWAGAIHYDLRKPNFVVIHHTAQNSVAQTVRTFQVPHSKVSAHYVISKTGQIIQMLNDYDRAWHAGKSKWGSIDDLNSMSIGIELDNNGKEPFPDTQINALLVLLDTLKTKYLIPQLNFIGHADIAPMRKDDPSILFPWKVLAQNGFGIWYNEDYLISPPPNFNAMDALKIMGYDMRAPEGAIRAFKRKYIIKEVNGVLTAHDQAVLYDLYRKYY